jgi:hypothetical protein
MLLKIYKIISLLSNVYVVYHNFNNRLNILSSNSRNLYRESSDKYRLMFNSSLMTYCLIKGLWVGIIWPYYLKSFLNGTIKIPFCSWGYGYFILFNIGIHRIPKNLKWDIYV